MNVTESFYNHLPNYHDYLEKIIALYAQGKTTGDNQSAEMLGYTKLGISRTKRGIKTYKINDELLNAAKELKATNWLVISEAWCGDAANTTPVVSNLADNIEGVTLKVMLRDNNPEIMENYLTNGGKAIPIVVFFDDEFNEVFRWGPRPAPAQKMVIDRKENPGESYEDFNIRLQKWYQEDKTQTVQKELAHLMSKN